MMNNIGGLLNMFRGFVNNPAQFLLQRKLPQDAFQNPQAFIQQQMNSGKISQSQFNQLQQMARQIQSNPMFAQMFGK